MPSQKTIGFGERLYARMRQRGPVCVGIDPHPQLLQAWGLEDSPAGLREFSLRVLEAVAGRAAAIKPQSAFYERHGSVGVAVLEELLSAARQAGEITILDIKRGDIGSTMQGYAEAYLGSGPLSADAVTLTPYLGFESLRPALDLARAANKGIFVLGLTSNPEGAQVQRAIAANGVSVAGNIVQAVSQENAPSHILGIVGNVGLVIGATIGTAVQELGLDLRQANGILLAPGVGAQGGGSAELEQVFGQAKGYMLASVSRSVLERGPELSDLKSAVEQIGVTISSLFD